ncbi:MAG: T9SS type A sorting domain-containing protein [Chitinophagaceae bacterium]
MKHAYIFGTVNRPWDTYTGTYSSITYYPSQSFGLIVISNVDPIHEAFMYGTYKLSFKGQATVTSDDGIADNGVTVTNQQYDASTNTTTADVYFDLTKGTQINLNFINPVNIDQLKMISPGYSTTNPPLIRNEMVKILNQFNQLRFMDWLLTNSNPVTSWADRHLPSLPGLNNRNNQRVGCAWEDVCAFANQLNKDIWVNIPGNADDDYVIQCATLLKNNLNPNINVYVEYSNEVWNYFSYGFQQSVDNLNAANAEVSAGNSTLNNDGETNEYAWASRRVVKRIYEISNLFKTAWGANQINNRIRCVVAGQYPYNHGDDLDWFNKTYAAPKNFFWGIANATYWTVQPTDANNTSATVSELLDQLETSKNDLFANRAMDLAPAIATYYGLEMMGYEGGPDTYGPNNQQIKADLNFDPRMKTISADYLTQWYQNGGKQFNWYYIGNGGNYVSQYGTWNLLGWLQDSLLNMKYQGVQQILNGTTPAITAGLSIPGTHLATQTVGYGVNYAATKFICSNAYEINYDTYFLNSPAAGNYDFSVKTSQAAASSKALVYVNNVLMPGEVAMSVQPGYNSSSLLPIILPKGLVTIRVAYTHSDVNRVCLLQQDFTISQASALPVKLENFAAVADGNTVKVTWKSTEEINSSVYIVQRSADGVSFTTIGQVNAKGYAADYSLVDPNPIIGDNYYRLKPVDKDGKFTYSKVVKVNFTKLPGIRISPNPASSYLYISLENINSPVNLQLVNTNGQVVKQTIITQNLANKSISLVGLPKGLYSVKLVSQQKVTTQKLVIQ